MSMIPYWLQNVVLICIAASVVYILWLSILFFKKKARELERLNSDLKLIQNLSKDITATLEMRDLLPQIMDAFAKASNVTKGSIMLMNEETQTLEIKAGIGLSPHAYDVVKMRLAEGVAGVVAATCESILIDDTSKEKYLYMDFKSDEQKPRPKETLLCLPLIFKGHVLGVVSLDKKIGGEKFSEYDRRITAILANQAAVAIQNARLYENAITDGLTELYIHKYFHNRLEKEMDRAKRFNQTISLIMFDIDYFKNFNDVYGHQVGDLALVHLSKILRNTMRLSDILARYGGEEFAVILIPDPKMEQTVELVKSIAERLRKNVENSPLEIKGQKLKITISIGIVSWHGEKRIDKDKLIKMADDALYTAKRSGRNRVCVWEEMIVNMP
ncbi:MAG: sensor domain-containing diguanylate cyclase [Elusimicrobia bacterium]|nr:sensor domain-containing diguanylate cyclase [Elusimicrobiota bacterium]